MGHPGFVSFTNEQVSQSGTGRLPDALQPFRQVRINLLNNGLELFGV